MAYNVRSQGYVEIRVKYRQISNQTRPSVNAAVRLPPCRRRRCCSSRVIRSTSQARSSVVSQRACSGRRFFGPGAVADPFRTLPVGEGERALHPAR